MNRCIFYNKVTVDGEEELDHLWNSLSSFTMRYNPTHYRVDASDLMRPWRISKKNYGSDNLWWVILAWNGIENPLTDLIEGMILVIPNKLDILEFQKRNSVR